MPNPLKGRIDQPELVFWLLALFILVLLGFGFGRMSANW